MDAPIRHAVTFGGDPAGRPLLFSHGFGCDQAMWTRVATRLPEYRSVLFDLVGFGRSHYASYDLGRHDRLNGHAADVIELCAALELDDVVFVGHSVSAMIGVLAAVQEPTLFSALVLVGPSPRYIDTDDYRGGFSREAIDEMLSSLAIDFMSWSEAMAPAIVGAPATSDNAQQLTASFCRSDPTIAKHFAQVTFRGDNRDDLAQVRVPTLVLQCRDDIIAPTSVGEYVHSQIAGSELVYLRARGHCPNLTAPDETAEAIRAFLSR